MIPQSALTVAGSLAGVLALIGALAALVRHRRWPLSPARDRTLLLRETLAVDPRRRLHLVQAGDRQVLLLTGGSQDLVVGWLPPP